jgi:hypothetical protein
MPDAAAIIASIPGATVTALLGAGEGGETTAKGGGRRRRLHPEEQPEE